MPGPVTVIGLGAFGSRLAKSIKARKPECRITGSDPEQAACSAALAQKYADHIEHNRLSAVKNAGLILLAVPADQTKSVLEHIGHDVSPDAVILDCCPAKTAAAAWARQYLARPENFAGIWAGSGTLFTAADAAVSEAALKTAAELAGLLELKHTFADPAELDGLIASVYDLPILAAAGLTACLSERPGWKDRQNAAGETLLQMTAQARIKTDRDGSGTALMSHRESTVRLLDEYIRTLGDIRDLIRRQDESGLRTLTENSRKAAAELQKAPSRSGEEHTMPDLPGTADFLRQTFFGGLLRKKNRN